jgi:outer membrane biosynthesis protein TonB
VSYQSEERYWTDYVRVATPIVGLLLLLGVFWYWANSLIGADSSAPPPTAVLTVIPDDTPTPTPTTEAIIEDTPAPDEPTETAGAETPPTRTPRPADDEPTATPEEEEQPTEEPAESTDESSRGGEFEEGQTLITTSDVRMRAEPSTESDIVEELAADVELVVVSGTPQEAEGYVWWNVRNEATESTGWVVDDWLAAADS